ncbi:MAG: biotin--[acetyl-CoA-carboxylase] ligase [Oscillospiraceae bacterium]|jgi:BirA family biotin operon repressor/biotin-[acetyl-CoA-carboxylase] ligase|nr:biotin--[acetyl-CoA-carboxylase] ligase [Oscillospiraceae bacterium]
MQEIVRLRSTGSVLDDLREMAKKGAPAGTCVVSRVQRAGRGQHGRGFHSAKGGLYFALLFRPSALPDELLGFTARAGEAMRRAVREMSGIDPAVKPPNDLLFGARKLCGILCEGSAQGGRQEYIACGVGLNLNQTSFPPELADIAVSLRMLTGQYYAPRPALLLALRYLSELCP